MAKSFHGKNVLVEDQHSVAKKQKGSSVTLNSLFNIKVGKSYKPKITFSDLSERAINFTNKMALSAVTTEPPSSGQ